MKRRRTHPLSFEPLERRDLLTAGDIVVLDGFDPLNSSGGNVTAELIDGKLVVRGDGANNQIEIIGGGGVVSIQALNGRSTVNGQSTGVSFLSCEVKTVTFTGVTNGIDIAMGDGDDVVILKGRDLPAVNIATGVGDDYVALGGYDPQSPCVITHSIKFPRAAIVQGDLAIDMGDGDDTVSPYAVVKGNAVIKTGSGADRIVEPEVIVVERGRISSDRILGGRKSGGTEVARATASRPSRPRQLAVTAGGALRRQRRRRGASERCADRH